MRTYAVGALLAFLVALFLTPLVRRLALCFGAVDDASRSQRKIHAGGIPRLGGIAIVLAFYAPLLGLLIYETDVGAQFLERPLVAFGLMGGGGVIATLGVVDDLFSLSARTKLLVQFLVAVSVVGLGFKIHFIALPFLPEIEGILVYPLTIIWIIGITNAVNLIDGLDGLAAGISFFGILPMIVLALLTRNVLLGLICCTLAGAVLGFLFHNFYPTKIFMGDSGSMFLGFVLSLVTVQASSKNYAVAALTAPILALGFPILDTLLAIARRTLTGRPVFTGDAQHIHHRLMARGYGQKRTVLILYLVGLTFAAASIGVSLYRDVFLASILGASILTSAILLRIAGMLPIFDLPEALRESARLRRQNRLRYKELQLATDRLKGAQTPTASLAFVEELCHLVGAVAWDFQLTVAGGLVVKAQGVVNENSLRLPIYASEQQDIGSLVVDFGERWEVDVTAVSLLEKGCLTLGRLAKRMEKSVEAKPHSTLG